MRAFEKEYRSKGKARADYIYGATVGKVARERKAKKVRLLRARGGSAYRPYRERDDRERLGLFHRVPYKERLQMKRDRLEIAERKERLRVSRLNRRKVR